MHLVFSHYSLNSHDESQAVSLPCEMDGQERCTFVCAIMYDLLVGRFLRVGNARVWGGGQTFPDSHTNFDKWQ